eukprot:gene29205-16982_t
MRRRQPAAAAAAAPGTAAVKGKTKPNAPCPCGAGRKYKHLLPSAEAALSQLPPPVGKEAVLRTWGLAETISDAVRQLRGGSSPESLSARRRVAELAGTRADVDGPSQSKSDAHSTVGALFRATTQPKQQSEQYQGRASN